ncbi:WD40-repeat-containing domain protein [Suillus subalutaceus]|uniref:WD40-repeat-containing domain protein n=1 Tax=Suillus subalutaceus TaxID=48586 RepID=UPI001B86AAB8|nr:WD40-repeat-containing domain protein [Suillus subalutaceus]KAG1844637.1 WD40-repeat-containing domain protein [Suillus subalutaceus]
MSPNGKTVVSGSIDGKVRLWNVETGKIVARWIGHTEGSGSWDRTARVWNVKSGETILEIKTGHNFVWAVIYSPDQTKIATGGYKESAVKIWDAETSELLATPCLHDYTVWSLAWTSDGNKLISASKGPIRIFDTATWNQIPILEGHTAASWVSGISLSQNNRPPCDIGARYNVTALSADGKVLVTGCMDNNVYLWDVQAILKEADIKDQLPPGTDVAPKDQKGEPGIEHTPRSSIGDKSFLENCSQSSQTGGTHLIPLRVHSSLALPRFSTAFDLITPKRPDFRNPRRLRCYIRGCSWATCPHSFHRSPPQNDEANEPQQTSTPSGLDLHALFAHLSSLLPRSRLNEETEPRPTTPLSSRPDALVDFLSSLFRAQHRTSEELELPQRTIHPHVVEVPAMRDREVLYVSPQPPPHRPNTQRAGNTVPGARPAYSLPVRMLAHLGLVLCCKFPRHPDGNAHSTQEQQGQSQGPVQTQAPSPQTQAPLPQTQAPSPQTQGSVTADSACRPVGVDVRGTYCS